MNREKEELIPFQTGVNINLFFPGAERRELLDELKKSLADGVTVLSIIGDEGTGKTMLCRMVENELSEEFVCVCLPENLESFNEVIGILASETGIGDIAQSQSIDETISSIIDTLIQRSQRLVVIFDQAERMYLAMLERLRKLLDKMNGHENLLQLIFAGRRVLLENLDQLAICDFADAAETHFYLDYLDMSETYAYLNHCARQRSRAKGKSLFTPEASKKIFNIARGNFKTTNILAAKSIESADAEGSFVVAPRNVSVQDTGIDVFHESFLAGVRRRSGWLITGALLLLICVLLIALLMDGDENKQTSQQQPARPYEIRTGTDQDIESLSSSSLSEREPADTGLKEEPILESGIDESSIVFKKEGEEQAAMLRPADQVESSSIQNQSGLENNTSSKIDPSLKNSIESKGSDLLSKEVPEDGVGITEGKSKDTLSEPIAAKQSQVQKAVPSGEVVDQKQTDSHVKVSGLSVKEEVDGNLIPQHKKKEKGAQQKPEQIKKQEKKILIGAGEKEKLEQQEISTVLEGAKMSVPNTVQSIAAPKQLFKVAKVKLPISGTAALKKAQQQPAISDGNLYEQRVAAGKAWFSRKMEGAQTIQVMALTGESAEKNLRELFSRQQYKEIADNLYILESKNSSTFFVYYGAFPDRESANRIKEQFPPFLGKNEPYVISILEAKSKITPQ